MTAAISGIPIIAIKASNDPELKPEVLNLSASSKCKLTNMSMSSPPKPYTTPKINPSNERRID